MVHGLSQDGETQGTTAAAGSERPLLVVMLPARNAEEDLPGYLENVATFCDMVVALDDGSTDRTHDILASHPLVKVLLRNPRREDYRGWDDAANRNRLLAAANELQPTWLFSLDADERLDARDAASLREFIQTDALPGFAYGLRHVSMRGDTEHFLPKYLWYYRLFSAAPGQRFPNQKLHFVPVPTNIPRSRWLKTSLRIQHLGELNAERRLNRFGKYLEADPARRYEDNYAEILGMPAAEEIRRWLPRPESVPVLLADPMQDDLDGDVADASLTIPAFSVIVIDRDNDGPVRRALASAVGQQLPGRLETLVVTRAGSPTERMVRESFPSVKLVSLPGPVVAGEAHNQALLHATGRYVAFLDAGSELLPGSLAARLAAHGRRYAMVTGGVANGAHTPAGWASYLLEHVDSLPGLPAAEVREPLPDCSYAQLPLNEVGGFPETAGVDVERTAAQSIIGRGYVAFRDASVQTVHHGATTVGGLLRSQFRQGRTQGGRVLARHRESGRLLQRRNVTSLVAEALPARLQHLEASVRQADDIVREHYRRHRRLVALGAVAATVGLWWEILKPGQGKAEILWGRPVLTVLLGGQDGFALAQLDAVSNVASVQPVPPNIKGLVGSRYIPLADLLPTDDTSGKHALQKLRTAAAAAFDVDALECIIDRETGRGRPPERRAAPTPWIAGPLDVMRRVWRVSLGTRAQRNPVQSTLGPWTTARVLRQVGDTGL